jgi:hypothetical protein
VYQTAAEHGVQLDLVILQDVLKGASGTVLGEEATMRSCDAGANEPHQMIVSHIFHLNEKERERLQKEQKKNKSDWLRGKKKPEREPVYMLVETRRESNDAT